MTPATTVKCRRWGQRDRPAARSRAVTDLTLRRYRPADADRVWAVHEAALRASPLEFVEDAPADADLREIEATYLDAGGEFLVGVVVGRVVAVGGFRPADGDDDAVEIRRMRVHPDHQREGYGGRVLSALETRARDRGFDAAVLETNERLAAAQRLYERRGYEVVGRDTRPVTGDEFVSFRKEL